MAEFLFGPTPNEEAADFIKDKPLVTRRVFDQLLPELKARAFVVTGIENAEVLQRVRDTIAELPAGGDWKDLKGRVMAEVSPFLVTSDDPEERAKQEYGAERRAELLLRTHGQQAYAAAGYRLMDAQRDLFPLWQYLSLGDGHVRQTHAALDKVVLPHDSPFWRTHTPPWEWGCRCQVVPLSPEDGAEIAAADAQRAPEARQMLDARARQKLERENILVRHADPAGEKGAPTPFNVQSPAEAGKPGALHWQPGDLRLSVEDLRGRYDAGVFGKFEQFAKQTELPELKQTVWEWLHGRVLPPSAPAVLPAAQVEPSFQKAVGALGLDKKLQWMEQDVRDLLKAMKKPGAAQASAKLEKIMGAQKTGLFSEAGLKRELQEVLSLLPRKVADALPKLTIEVVPKLGNTLGDYDFTTQTIRYNLGLLGQRSPDLARETVWHELMHWMHMQGPQSYRDAITSHFAARTAGEKIQQLGGFRATGKPDKWWDVYAGVVYPGLGETGTEVPTRYFQLFAHPAHLVNELAGNPNAGGMMETMKVVMSIFDDQP